MNVRHEHFWRQTWERWRNGLLNELSPYYANTAAHSFEQFMSACQSARDVGFALFLDMDPPQPGEFLLAHQSEKGRPVLVMTNTRLWLFNKANNALELFPVPDIATYRSVAKRTGLMVSITFRDGSERTLEVPYGPVDQMVAIAIRPPSAEQAGSPDAPRREPVAGVATQNQKPVVPIHPRSKARQFNIGCMVCVIIGIILMSLSSLIDEYRHESLHYAAWIIGLCFLVSGISAFGASSSTKFAVGNTTTEYRCPACSEVLSLDAIPAKAGTIFECYHCHKSIRS